MNPTVALRKVEYEEVDERSRIIADICDVFTIPGKKIEIARAAEGGSQFNSSTVYESFTHELFNKLLDNAEKNRQSLAFGICREPSYTFGRANSEEHVKEKAVLSLDIDLKEFTPGLEKLSALEKKKKVEDIFYSHKEALEQLLGPVWMAVFSGNGLHLHWKLLDHIPTERWKDNYKDLVKDVTGRVFRGVIPFDTACSDSARLMRLPYSTNFKEKGSPIQTEVIYWDSKSDASQKLEKLFRGYLDIRQSLNRASRGKSEGQFNRETEEIKQALSYEAILEHFGKTKSLSSIRDVDDEKLCCTPIKKASESNPSFYFGPRGWYCFSTAKGGGILSLIGELSSPALDPSVPADFKEILRIAREIAHIPEPVRKAVTVKGSRPFTDMGNAERFSLHANGDARFSEQWVSWLVFDGSVWRKSELLAIARAKETVRRIYSEAEGCEDSAERKLIADHARKSESDKAIRAMLHLARAEGNIPLFDVTELDSHHYLLNVANGTLDLRTGELLPFNKENMLTKQSPTVFNPEAPCPLWEKFLSEVFQENSELISFVQRAVGYSLTGDSSERVIFILHGSGINGKSTFNTAISHMLGEDFSCVLPAESLLAKKNDDAVPCDIAKLKGIRFVISKETKEGKKLAEERVKDLTGNEKITARFMRENFFDFYPECKIWLGTNHRPVISGDQAVWDRIRLIPFNVSFADRIDTHLPEKLKAEASGILNWAIQGCLAWQREGLGCPEAVEEATKGYQEEMDVIGNFLRDCTVRKIGAEVNCRDFHEAYRAWCEENGYEHISQPALSKELKRRGLQEPKLRTGKRYFWQGIEIAK